MSDVEEPENGSFVMIGDDVYERDDMSANREEEKWFDVNQGTDSYTWPQLIDKANHATGGLWLMTLVPNRRLL